METQPLFGAGRSHADDHLVGLLRQVADGSRGFEHFLADEIGVDAPGLLVMEHLHWVKNATPTELARHLGLSTAAMTLVLTRLERAGHVVRTPHPADGRKVVVTASEESLRSIDNIVGPWLEGLAGLHDSMTEAQRQTVSEYLERVVALSRAPRAEAPSQRRG